MLSLVLLAALFLYMLGETRIDVTSLLNVPARPSALPWRKILHSMQDPRCRCAHAPMGAGEAVCVSPREPPRVQWRENCIVDAGLDYGALVAVGKWAFAPRQAEWRR